MPVTTRSIAQRESALCRFLELLPAELRNRIYEYVVQEEDIVTVLLIGSKLFVKQPILVLVSSQVRTESLAVFYACNTFRFFYDFWWTNNSSTEIGQLSDPNGHIANISRLQISTCFHKNFYVLEKSSDGMVWEMTKEVGEERFTKLDESGRSGCFVNERMFALGKAFLRARLRGRRADEGVGFDDFQHILSAMCNEYFGKRRRR